MSQEKVHVGARIPKDLAMKCEQRYGNMTNAINIALELLFNQSENITENNVDKTENNVDKIENDNEVIESKIRVEERDIRIQDLKEQIKAKDENQLARIADLKETIISLNDQLNKKDKLLEELNQTLLAQASNIYNLTQNPKLLPENKVKRWYEFWKN
jgi:Mg2+ and Co2+ transporter CorA